MVNIRGLLKLQLITILILSCQSNRSINTTEIFTFAQIPVENTIFINKDYLYYASVDLPINDYSIRCIDIVKNKTVF